jgi:hypothetical protein
MHAPSRPRNGLSASIHAPSSPPRPGLEASMHAPSRPRNGLSTSIHARSSPPRPGLETSMHAPNPSSVPAFCTPSEEVLNASIHTPIEHEHGSLKVTSLPPSRVPATEPAKKTSSTSLHYCPSPPTPPLLRATRGLSASMHAPSSLPWPGLEASIHAPNPVLSASIHAFCTPPREVLCANIHAPVEYEPEFLNSTTAPFVPPVTEPSSSNTSLECYYSTPYPPGWGLGPSMHAPSPPSTGLSASMHAPSPPSTGLSASIHAPCLLPTHPPDVCTLALNENSDTPIEDEDELFTEPRPIPVGRDRFQPLHPRTT